MRKYVQILLLAVFVFIAAPSVSAQAASTDTEQNVDNKEITFVLPQKAGQGYTSLKFSMQVEGVSESATLSMDFDSQLPEKIWKKAVYQNQVLTIYLSGEEELFPAAEDTQAEEADESPLKVGTVVVENDENDGSNLKLQLIPDSIEVVNGAYSLVEDVDKEGAYVESMTNVPEPTPDPGLGETDNSGKEDTTTPTNPETLEDVIARLKTLLEELNTMVSSDYTPESWNTLYELMKEAQTMLDEGTASLGQVNEMIAKLEDAKSKLVKQEPGKPEDEKPEDKKPEDKKPEDKKPEDKKPEDKKSEDKKTEDKKTEGIDGSEVASKTDADSTDTGDNQPVVLFLATAFAGLAVCGAAGYGLKKRGRRTRNK